MELFVVTALSEQASRPSPAMRRGRWKSGFRRRLSVVRFVTATTTWRTTARIRGKIGSLRNVQHAAR